MRRKETSFSGISLPLLLFSYPQIFLEMEGTVVKFVQRPLLCLGDRAAALSSCVSLGFLGCKGTEPSCVSPYSVSKNKMPEVGYL
jgi:hypothetical protein